MMAVRLLLTLALLVQLSGVQAVAAPACAAGPGGAHQCCMRHETGAGGNVIGHCGCQAAPEPAPPVAVAATPASPSDDLVTDGQAAELPLGAPPLTATACSSVFTVPVGPGGSPPRLTGAGFRC